VNYVPFITPIREMKKSKKAAKAANQKQSKLTAKKFKAIRLSLGMTQDEFAEMLGYTSGRKIISMKENGTRQVSKQDELLLAQYL
jgi:DNA-binding transcriptional regulator YiaG